MRISDWSSDVCSPDLQPRGLGGIVQPGGRCLGAGNLRRLAEALAETFGQPAHGDGLRPGDVQRRGRRLSGGCLRGSARSRHPTDLAGRHRSEEHTSELQSLMRISYAVFCLKKKTMKTEYKTKVRKSNKK